MTLDPTRVGQILKSFDFETLFIEELGWDRCRASLAVDVDGARYRLDAIAEKRGVVAYVCRGGDARALPDYATRNRIEHQVARQVHEHLIVYTDDRTAQVWQWVRREPGKPLARREHHFRPQQSGQLLIQKLQAIAFSLEEEESLTLVDVTGGVRAAFDVERVTKRFYDEFTRERAAFEKFLRGLPDADTQRWYVSVMLNRLMFVYFIQKKGFLNGDDQYLRHQLAASQARGADRFYRDVLCPLFFDGFARPPDERPAEVSARLGRIPYLNGGIFQRHPLEELHSQAIDIPDAAFERLFTFFERYQWHLDERPMRNDNEINPDVLGYIFEKYVNQKQMGAYYTKEDITEYIAKNTIIPYLFDRAKRDCPTAFDPDGPVWRLLREDPDRYIYDAVRKGVELPLPPEIEAGITDVAQRGGWNRRAPEAYALPTEIWREVVARRQRYAEVRQKLADGEVHAINDLITYNLNIRQFAQDVIQSCDDPALLRAFYHAIEHITVLDPTVGSGAFLFAALNILEPLYEACLERMAAFLYDQELATPSLGAPSTSSATPPPRFKDFCAIRDRAEQHPNRRYFILKSIIVNNLFGVDIMKEAVEICQLRLFLKLVAQVDRVEHIEPLPDIDFNIRAGNSLVGYATAEQVRRAFQLDRNNQYKLLSSDDRDAMRRFEEKVADVDRLFALFRQQQTELGGPVTPGDKAELRRRLGELEEELNRRLAVEYGVDPRQPAAYQRWLASHQPFHWFVEFYGTVNRGGFDVIIGNPPYVEYSQVKREYQVRGYETLPCGNLYALLLERSLSLARPTGKLGMIVPLSLASTERMYTLRALLIRQEQCFWFSFYDVYPSKLFEGAKQRLTIALSGGTTEHPRMFSTRYYRWKPEERINLFANLAYWPTWHDSRLRVIPKVPGQLGETVLTKLLRARQSAYLPKASKTSFYVHRIPYNYVKALNFVPYFWSESDGVKKSEDYKPYYLEDTRCENAALAMLSSNLFFYWWYTLYEGYHCGKHEIYAFPTGLDRISNGNFERLTALSNMLMTSMLENKKRKRAEYKSTGKVVYDEFYPRLSKHIIDEIDRVLAQHYGFTDEELDFIINYDIKYRMGDGLEGGDDGGEDE